MPKFVGKPGYLDTLRIQSIEAAQKGNIPRALDLARRYHARRPGDVRVLNHLAHMHQQLGDWAGVVKYGRRSYELEPIAHHLGILIEAYARLERFEPLVAFCRSELVRRSWKDALREPGIHVRLTATLIRARYRVWLQRRREHKARKAAHRVLQGEDARRAEGARRTMAEQGLEGASLDLAAKGAGSEAGKAFPAAPPPWPAQPACALPIVVDLDTSALASELAGLDRKTLAAHVHGIEIPAPYLKREGLADLFQHQFHGLNVRLEFKGARESAAEYLGVGLFFEARTDDRPDGIVEVWINTDTGAAILLPSEALAGATPCSSQAVSALKPLTAHDIVTLMERASRKSGDLVRDALRLRLHDAQEELDRAIATLRDRHRKTWDEFASSPGTLAAALPPGLEAELTQRVQLARDEADGLAAAHAVHVDLRPVDLRRLRLPIMLCNVVVTRRQTSRPVLIAFNPLLRQLEPLPCHHCDRDTYGIGATDAGELLCSRCVKH